MSERVVVTVVTTDEAAVAVGQAPSGFRTWARRAGLQPIRTVRVGRATVALWNLDEVYDAARRVALRHHGDRVSR